MAGELKPCPFCGAMPTVIPLNPDIDGNAWGAVVCENRRCGVRPRSQEAFSERGSNAAKRLAIQRWNRRKP